METNGVDYVTNSQQLKEISRLARDVEILLQEIDVLVKENERLKEMLDLAFDGVEKRLAAIEEAVAGFGAILMRSKP